MKAKYLTFIGTALALAATSGVAVAQSGGTSTQFKLSPQGTQLLCKEFPLNSRCTGSETKPSASPASTTTEPSPSVSPPSTMTEPSASPPSSTTEPSPSVSPPSTTTEPGTRRHNTTEPGTTTPPIGTPPGAGSQKKPYVTPQ